MESVAKLKNCPLPPRKMRLLADHIRGMRVEKALNVLRFHPKRPYAKQLEKLVLSGIANWEEVNENEAIEDHDLYISTLQVDEGRVLKRIRPAAQGRAHRIRKRSSHVFMKVMSAYETGTDASEEDTEEEDTEEDVTEEQANTTNE